MSVLGYKNHTEKWCTNQRLPIPVTYWRWHKGQQLKQSKKPPTENLWQKVRDDNVKNDIHLYLNVTVQNKQIQSSNCRYITFKDCLDNCNLQDKVILLGEFMTTIQQSFYICLTDKNFSIHIILSILLCSIPLI